MNVIINDYTAYISNIKFFLAISILLPKGKFFSSIFFPQQNFILFEYVMKMLLWVIIFVSFYAYRAFAKKKCFFTFLSFTPSSIYFLILLFTFVSHKVKEIFSITIFLCERFVKSLRREISALPWVNVRQINFKAYKEQSHDKIKYDDSVSNDLACILVFVIVSAIFGC